LLLFFSGSCYRARWRAVSAPILRSRFWIVSESPTSQEVFHSWTETRLSAPILLICRFCASASKNSRNRLRYLLSLFLFGNWHGALWVRGSR
jgi:hypothetical protein